MDEQRPRKENSRIFDFVPKPNLTSVIFLGIIFVYTKVHRRKNMDYAHIKNLAFSGNYSTFGSIEYMATRLLRETGLYAAGWRFTWSKSRHGLGVCWHHKRKIALSKPLVNALKPKTKREQIIDVILHEIAHALTPGARHGYKWRQVAKALGANGERCYDMSIIDTSKVDYKWRITCDKCGREWHQNRLTRRRRMQYEQCLMRHSTCGGRDFTVKQLR